MKPLTLFCNGNPKSGTNAVLKIVEAMGCSKEIFVRALDREEAYYRPSFDQGGESILLSEEARKGWEEARDRHVIERDNALVRKTIADFPERGAAGHCHVSWRRRAFFADFPVVTVFRNPRDNYLSWLGWWKNGEPVSFFVAYPSFYGWVRRPHLVYDDLFTTPSVQKIAGLMGRDISEAEAQSVIDRSYGRSTTWSGKVSDHRQAWTPELDETWKRNGGEALDAAFAAIRDGIFQPPADRFDPGFTYDVAIRPRVARTRRKLKTLTPDPVLRAYRRMKG